MQEVRKVLIKTIRSDYLALTSRLSETSYEILFTRFSLHNYQSIIASVQGLQQALITASSALDLIDELDPEGRNHRHLMARAETARTFNSFRHGIDLVIAEIIDNLVGPTAASIDLDEAPSDVSTAGEEQPVGEAAAGAGAGGVDAQAPAFSSHNAAHPTKSSSPGGGLAGGETLHTSPTTPATNRQMLTIAARLKREVQNTEARHQRIRRESNARRSASSRPSSIAGARGETGEAPRHWARRLSGIGPRDESLSRERERGRTAEPSPRESDETAVSEDGDGDAVDHRERDLEQALPGEEAPGANRAKTTDVEKATKEGADDDDVVEVFRKAWDAFARAQQNALVSLIKDGALEVDDVLRIEEGMPSIKQMYADRLPKGASFLLPPSPPSSKSSIDVSPLLQPGPPPSSPKLLSNDSALTTPPSPKPPSPPPPRPTLSKSPAPKHSLSPTPSSSASASSPRS